jgi:hypothetical protein
VRRLAKFLGVIVLVSAVAAPSWAETVVTPADDADNGFVVQAPTATWGIGQTYGSGQAFMVLRETGSRDDDGQNGSVVFRVNRYGGLGNVGGAHFACGLRGPTTDPGVPPGQCVWIQSFNDTVGEVISKPTSKDYQWMLDGSEVVWKVGNQGQATGRREVVARDGQSTRVQIGTAYGVAGVAMGQIADTTVYRKAASLVGIGNAAWWPKLTSAPTAVVGGAITYSMANSVTGKLELRVQFPTGAPVVVATEP